MTAKGQRSKDRGQKTSRAGWICAVIVLTVFGLQQVVPLRTWFALRSADGAGLVLLRSFSCMLVHGNCLHAAMNAAAFVCLFRGLIRGYVGPVLLVSFFSGWIATVLFASFLMPQHATLVGSSGILFGALGVFTAWDPFSRWQLFFMGSIPLIVLAPLIVAADATLDIMLVPCAAWPVHTAAWSIGAITVSLLRAATRT
ncbi:MAG: rhomboid family intramembrane serine protease [Kiritimatiellales bacterium]